MSEARIPKQLHEALKRASGGGDIDSVKTHIDLITERQQKELLCYFRAVRMALEKQTWVETSHQTRC